MVPLGLLHPEHGFHWIKDIDPRDLATESDHLMDTLKLADWIIIDGQRCRIDECFVTTLLDVRMAQIFEHFH